jgi:hypothetical protein
VIERLLDIEVGPRGTITVEVEVICCMTGLRRRMLVHYLENGFFRSVELEAG